MPIYFFLLVNKQGQTKFSKYYNVNTIPSDNNNSAITTTQLGFQSFNINVKNKAKKLIEFEERVAFEGEISRKCMRRSTKQVKEI